MVDFTVQNRCKNLVILPVILPRNWQKKCIKRKLKFSPWVTSHFLYLETSWSTDILLSFTWPLISGLCLKANTRARTVLLYEPLTNRELWWNTSLSTLSTRPQSSCWSVDHLTKPAINVPQKEEFAAIAEVPETLSLTLTRRLSDISLLALLLSPSDCLSERTSIDGLLEFSSMNVLHSV